MSFILTEVLRKDIFDIIETLCVFILQGFSVYAGLRSRLQNKSAHFFSTLSDNRDGFLFNLFKLSPDLIVLLLRFVLQ
jgi:hypothetical protein